MRQSQITFWCHELIRSQAVRGGMYVDATMGKGNDTLFLCELAGDEGNVIAFDIQEKALEITEAKLKEKNIFDRVRLILDSHEHMGDYIEKESIDVICFNFGYLPGGDHKIATKPDTSLSAVKCGLELLKHGGLMSLCIYSGQDTGFEEKESLLSFLKTLPSREYTVIVNEYWNRENNPPIPVLIFKE